MPLKGNSVEDDFRLQHYKNSLQELLKTKSKIVILAHLRRPGGQRVPALSLKPLAPMLQNLLNHPVEFVEDCIGRMAEQKIAQAKPGSILLMENIRFHPGEIQNDTNFAKQLAKLGDVYINDAFPNCHRDHASMSTLPKLLPSSAGPLLIQELTYIHNLIESPKRPVCLILGGLGTKSKIQAFQNAIFYADQIMLGGALANTILAAKDIPIGRTAIEAEHLSPIRDILVEAGIIGCRLQLPQDVVTAKALNDGSSAQTKLVKAIEKDDLVMDIGPKTLEVWSRVLQQAKTIIWTGPLGVCEFSPFEEGSAQIANAIMHSDAKSLIGGGDTLLALQNLKIRNMFKHISTGGAAFHSLLAGEDLPALTALQHQ